MKKTIYEGSGVAIVTPMNKDGSINYNVFDELIEKQIKGNTDAIVVCGTSGEASTLSDEEHIEAIRFTAERTAGRVPVVAGTGSNDTAYAAELSAAAEKAGADALLSVTPYYNKASQEGLYRHFKLIADAVHIPIILYNIPPRTNVNLSIETLKKLSEHPNITAVKESGGDVNYFLQIINECELDVYSGDDYLTVPVMTLGVKGVISVFANIIPEVIHEMCRLCFDNDFRAAGQMLLKYARLRDALFLDVNPVPIKAAMNELGMNVGSCRLPLCDMEEKNLKILRAELKRVNLI